MDSKAVTADESLSPIALPNVSNKPPPLNTMSETRKANNINSKGVLNNSTLTKRTRHHRDKTDTKGPSPRSVCG